MAKQGKNGDYYDVLRARMAGDASRAPDVAFRAPADPTDHYFGAEAGADEPADPRLFDPSALRPMADDLATRIDAHGRSESFLFAQTIRLGVGILWLGVAGWFFLNGAEDPGLVRLFALIGAAGAGAALIGALVMAASGRSSRRTIVIEARQLGQRIALEAQSLSARIERGVDAVSADAFLKSTGFVGDGDNGRAQFSSYLRRERGPTRASGATYLFIGALLFVIAGAAVLGTAARIDAIPLAGYPLAFAAAVIGVILYAAAGFITKAFAAPLRAESENEAERRAYDALLSAYASARAPAHADLAARLLKASGRARMMEAPTERESERDEIGRESPRDSGPHFVETGFHAAPRAFRTDAFEKKFRG